MPRAATGARVCSAVGRVQVASSRLQSASVPRPRAGAVRALQQQARPPRRAVAVHQPVQTIVRARRSSRPSGQTRTSASRRRAAPVRRRSSNGRRRSAHWSSTFTLLGRCGRAADECAVADDEPDRPGDRMRVGRDHPEAGRVRAVAQARLEVGRHLRPSPPGGWPGRRRRRRPGLVDDVQVADAVEADRLVERDRDGRSGPAASRAPSPEWMPRRSRAPTAAGAVASSSSQQPRRPAQPDFASIWST